MRLSNWIVAAAGLLCALAACGGSDSIDEITLSRDTASIPVGGRVQLSATPDDVTWSSSNTAVVSVDGTGLATGVARGFADVVATAGSARAAARIVVTEGGVVGAGGGSVDALAGALALEVPAGAAATDSPVSVAPAALLGVDARLVPGTAVVLEFTPFTTPATLRYTVTADQAPLGLPRAWLRVARLDADTWTELATADDGARATAAITAPGTYAVRVAESPQSCEGRAHRQFDFWLGKWSVLDPTGTLDIGVSTISRDAGGCIIHEDYRAPGGPGGKSVSFYNPDTAEWYQTYYFGVGSPPLRMAGGFDGTSMVLYTAPAAMRTRFTWQDNGDGTVHQYSEFSPDGGVTWILGFDGTYRR